MKQMNGGKQNEWGKNLMRAVGMAGKVWQATTARRTGTAGRHSQRTLRPVQASKKQRPQMTGLAANKQPQMTSASRRAGKWGECNCWHS